MILQVFIVLLQFWRCPDGFRRRIILWKILPRSMWWLECPVSSEPRLKIPQCVLNGWWVPRVDKFILEILESQGSLSKFSLWASDDLTNTSHFMCSWLPGPEKEGMRDISMMSNHERRTIGFICLASVEEVWARRSHLPSILCFSLDSVLIEDIWDGKWGGCPLEGSYSFFLQHQSEERIYLRLFSLNHHGIQQSFHYICQTHLCFIA